MSFCQTFDKRLSNSPFLAKICLLRNISNCQSSLYCPLIWILFKPFMYSSQILPFSPRFAVLVKSLITNRPFFAISFEFLARHSLLIAKFAIFTKFVIFAKIPNGQHASFVISFNFCQTLWIVGKFVISVIIAICQNAPLWHLYSQLFVKPLITSCQICPFLSAHLNIWPNPWWIFGILDIFAEICLYCLNMPFSYNHYLHKMHVFLILI